MSNRFHSALAVAVALGACATAGQREKVGMNMRQGEIGKAVEVELEMISTWDGGIEGFKSSLRKHGYTDELYSLEQSEHSSGALIWVLSSTSLPLVRTVQRMVSFARTGSSAPGYVLLALEDPNKEQVLCVTNNLSLFGGKTKWDQETVPVASLDTDEIRRCTVKGEFDPSYSGLSREELLRKYFGDDGTIRQGMIEKLPSFNEFVYFLITQGFAPYRQGYTGAFAVS